MLCSLFETAFAFADPYFLVCNICQRSRSLINVDNLKIFATPRKLIHSLQDQNEESSDSMGSEELHRSSESVSSTQDIPAEATKISSPKLEIPRVDGLKGYLKSTRNTFGILFIIFATILCFILIDDQGEGYNLVPT